MSKKVILTGLRANNGLHIGNYFGALLPLIDMAKERAGEFQVNLFVPDLHSFTTPIDHGQLQEQILNNLRVYVAAGLPLNDSNVHIYRQSYVPAHSELTIILNSFTGVGEMERMTQFKDKSAKLGSQRVSVGLFDYPVLMAADILLYGANYVPVGDDQSQHLEITRDLAQRLNKRFGELFVVPEPVAQQHQFFGKDQGLRIKDLVDPVKKMSKSDDSGKGVIFLNDAPETAAKKIMSATTDDKANIHFDVDGQPGVSNLLQIMALLQAKPVSELVAQYAGQNYSALKQQLARQMSEFLSQFQARLKEVDNNALQAKLEASERTMNDQANQTLRAVQKAIGLRP